MIEVRPPKLLPEPDGTAGLTKCRRAPTTKTPLPSEKGAGERGSAALRNPIWNGSELSLDDLYCVAHGTHFDKSYYYDDKTGLRR